MLKRLLLDNLAWKALSLVFAVALWLYVSTGTSTMEAPREVSVELKNLPDSLVRTSDVVSIHDATGTEFARGLIKAMTGVMVHRDDLVIL